MQGANGGRKTENTQQSVGGGAECGQLDNARGKLLGLYWRGEYESATTSSAIFGP